MSKTIVKTLQKTTDDPSFIIENASVVTFFNYGQNRVWLDSNVVIDPGDSFSEGGEDDSPINHSYDIRFIELGAGSNVLGDSSTKAQPAVDLPLVYSGNRLHIRILLKQH